MLSNPFQSFLNGLIRHWERQRRMTRTARRLGGMQNASRPVTCVRDAGETLEDRLLLSATPTANPTFIVEGHVSAPRSGQPATSPKMGPSFVAPINPAQMQAAYGVNLNSFNGVKGTGQGQTIAIVDAFNDPGIISDANSFSSTFGLPQFNSGGPTLQVLNENGGTSLSGVPNSTPGGWDVEESLDVEWAHSIAPLANIILFEANSSSLLDLLTAEQAAANAPGVSTVSNSWSSGEFAGETADDSYFETPSGHQGVTFLASTGDDGAPAGYPAYSPNVVAVGGTTLGVSPTGAYQAETGWSGSGGGVSVYEAQPSYQFIKARGGSATQRTAPDISMDADPSTGVYVLDSFDGGYLQVGGTSLSCPMMAALVSIADQGRMLSGRTTLDGYTQTLPALYNLSSGNFHDIVQGNNGYPALIGYDMVTGLGTAVANDIVPALVGNQTNQPPSVSGSGSFTSYEDFTTEFEKSFFAVTDSAASGTSDSVSLSDLSGTISLQSTSGVTFISGSNNSSSMTITGTLTNLNGALYNLYYHAATGYSGEDYLQVSAYDANDNEMGWAGQDIVLVPETPPTVTAPTSVATNEYQPYTFSNTVSIGDIFASPTSDSVSISVDDGILTLPTELGLTFSQGQNASPSMTFSGSLNNINAALAGLVYTPNSGFSGSDSLSISASNSTYDLTGSATVPITVNPATAPPPQITAPASATLNLNTSYTFSGTISATDPFVSGSSDSLSLSVAHGTLALSSTTGLTFSNGINNSSSTTITGTLANLNAALDGLVYTPASGFSGSDTLQLLLSNSEDGLSGPASVPITVNAPPSVAAPSAASVNENSSLTFAGTVSVTDASASGTSDSVSLSVAHGKLALGSTTGLTFSAGANNSSSMTVAGTLTNLNAALNGLAYTPNNGYSGADSLAISVKDSGNSLTGWASVAMTVIEMPVVIAPANISVNENGSFTFTGTITATDAAATGTSDSLTLTVSDGVVTLGSTTGLTFTSGGNGTSSMTVTGTVASLNAAISGLVYAPNNAYAGSDSLQITLKDAGDNLSGAATVAIAVTNIAPPSVTAPATANVNENSQLKFAGNISISDPGASGASDSLTLSVTNGKLTLGSTTGLTFTSGSNNSASMTVTGTLANFNAALNGLLDTPTSGFSGHDSLQISVADSGDNLAGSTAVAINVNPFVTAPSSIGVFENVPFTFSSPTYPITLTDGAASGTSDSLTVTVLHGKLKLATTTGLTFTSGANGTSAMTVTGTLANLNSALNGLVYTPNSNYTGSDTLTIGGADSSDGLSGSAQVAITVSPKQIRPGVAISSLSNPISLGDATTDSSATDPSTQWAGLTAAMDILSA
jgi:hypothetical protein